MTLEERIKLADEELEKAEKSKKRYLSLEDEKNWEERMAMQAEILKTVKPIRKAS